MAEAGSSPRTALPERPENAVESASSFELGAPGAGEISLGDCPPTEAALPGDVGEDPTVISKRPPVVAPVATRGPVSSDLGRLLIGERLNHFELLSYVGGGGMGAVFRARDSMLNREVALKVLSRDQGADDETRRRFQNEAQSAARLDHDNIARVYYVGEDQGLNYIAFEFIEGVNLRDLVEQRGPLPLPEAISYTLQVAEALAHASSRDVVHRDIKPSNVIITAHGRAKLVDMGLARLHQVDRSADDLTASGVTLGTFDYISPEQAYDPRSADVRSDIYSLGCALYFMLTGQPPFPEGTVLQKLLQHKSEPPPDPRDFNRDLPDALAAILHRMLAKAPTERYQTAQDLIGQLQGLADRYGGLPVAPRAAPWTVPAPTAPAWLDRHLPWLLPVGVLVAVVAGLEYLGAQTNRAHDENPAAVRVASRSDGPTLAPESAERATKPPSSREAKHRPEREPVATKGKANATGASSPNKVPSAVDDAPSPDAASANDKSIAGADVSSPDHDQRNGSGKDGDPATQSPPADDDHAAIDSNSGAGAAEPTTAASDNVDAEPFPQDDGNAREPRGYPAPQPGLLIVTGKPGEYEPGVFSNLSAACAKAKDGDAIELCFNGRRKEMPVAISNLSVTIRAGKGFSPVVAFQPNDIDPVRYPRAMFAVSGGHLKLVNLSLELNVPRIASTDPWALVETRLARDVEVEKCVLTIRNATDQFASFHRGVAFFNVKGAPGADSMMKSSMGMTWEPVRIRLEDCVIRGEASLLAVNDMQPVNLLWRNGLLASSESLLQVNGSARQATPGDEVKLELRHLTASVRGGLCRFDGLPEAPSMLKARVWCSDCIVIGGLDAVLVEQLGVEPVPSQQQRLAWEGDHNFYQGFATFWRIKDRSSSKAPQGHSFEQWRMHWTEQHEAKPTWGGVAWKRSPPLDRPAHTYLPADFALDDRDDDNHARGGASDGQDAGLDVARLPAVRSEPQAGH